MSSLRRPPSRDVGRPFAVLLRSSRKRRLRQLRKAPPHGDSLVPGIVIGHWLLEFGVYLEFGIWCLVFSVEESRGARGTLRFTQGDNRGTRE